jgi:hypothetical protein
MKRTLASIAKSLSEEDIQELIRLKKTDDKKVVSLRRKRDKIAAALAAIEAEIAKLGGEAAPAKRGRRKGAKLGRKPGPKPGAKRGGKRRVNFTAVVRDVFAQAGQPLRAAEVVEKLPEAGIKVKDPADMKKRVSVVLASQKNSFEQVSRGVYQLKVEAEA